MSWSIGINFRQTSGYISDPAGMTYCIADAYPTTRGGATFGWVTPPSGDGRNRSTGVDVRLAGLNFPSTVTGGSGTFRLDLPATGEYLIRMAVGDATAAGTGEGALYDDASLIASGIGGSYSAGQFYDANDTLHASAAAWVSGNASRSHTFASTILRVTMTNTGSSGGRIAHLYVEQLSASSGSLLLRLMTEGLYVGGQH